MSNYDFHALLEPLEFQELVCDIVQLREGIFLETYKEGRDSGIDGFYTDGTRKIIVQVKRYQQDFKRLYYDLQHSELPKVRKLKPDRYILGVSIDFQPGEKEKIVELFKGYITTTSDVLSKKDINRLLREPLYKRIELAYPKLWLTSIAVFEKTLKESVQRATCKESAEELKEAIKISKVFVPTRVYRKALYKWAENHIIILSGEPGVGKTTMAYLLALAYLQPNNLDGFIWANSIDDIYAMLEDTQKQVFIVDDFWGSIFHANHRQRNDENRLDKLINRIVASNGDKRLILTTREYILQQGLQKQPTLKETLERYALICTMEEYGDDEKASILFRHLYASNLEYEYVKYLYINCDWIIHHQNYNPRVLALFLDKEPGEGSPEEYCDKLRDYFDEPGTFWKAIFLELSQEARIVAMLLLISSTPMRLTDMDCCYQKYIHECATQIMVKNLGDCIAELEKTMIKSFYSEEEETILLKFSMPAVQDFLHTYIKENSEQCIPLLLRCCNFYNQLQFLLEHQSMQCSDRVVNLIIQQCILHYYDYDDSYMEYDGSWNWDIDIDVFDNRGCLDRFFHLICYCDPERHLELYYFLETYIKNYCLTMGRGDIEAQYTDLHNLPDIIVRCVKKGMTFNGKDIIDKYCEEAFSVYHYQAMEKFQEVFPEEYSRFYNICFPEIKKELKSIILSELELLDDLCMEFAFDMLLDNIPDILKKFGLRYTKEFKQKIFFLYGREPISENREQVTNKNSTQDYVDREEQALEAVKEDAGNWLLGLNETYLDEDQITEIISKSSLHSSLKKELKKIIDTGNPNYIYDFLQTKESIELLLRALYDLKSHIPERESTLVAVMLWHIGRGDQELIKKLVSFCAESFLMIMYQEEPVLRAHQFLSSEVYVFHLKNDAQLREVVFEHLLIRDEQWIRFLHVPLFIFSHACIICMTSEKGELGAYYQELWGDNFNKFKQIIRSDESFETNIYYADFGTYYFKQYEWEGCIYRMFEELDPFHFNQVYVEPRLKRYLDQLGNGDDDSKVLKHISYCRIQMECNEAGGTPLLGYEMSDELCMIDHLRIGGIWDLCLIKIPKNRLKQLQKNETICEKKGNKWRILLYKIEDVELLKELGIYDKILGFVKELKNTYLRFLQGDYSQIKKLPGL